MSDSIGFVDAWANVPVTADRKLVPWSPAVQRWFGAQTDLLKRGSTFEDLVADMDANGVEKAIVTARHGWAHPSTRPVGPLATSHGMPDELFDEFCHEVTEGMAKFPGRIYGAVIIDPMGAMTAVRQLERAIKDFGFIVCRLFPAVSGVPPSDPLCYPIYTKCIELGVPVTVNLGIPGPRRRASLQQPMALEDVLLSYPELTVIGTHIGHPWHLETVALLQKHPNFHLLTSGWAPKYIPSEVIHLMNTRGSKQVMWASDYPLLSIARTTSEAKELPLKPEVKPLYFRNNALELFQFDKKR